MVYEIEITRISDEWVEGRVVNPVNEILYVSVQLRNVLSTPASPFGDGHVFRPGVGTARKPSDPWLKVGDFVMVDA